MAQTFKTDEARARTFNTMPLCFLFGRNSNLTLNSTSCYEMLCSIGIKKEEWSKSPPIICPTSCHANLRVILMTHKTSGRRSKIQQDVSACTFWKARYSWKTHVKVLFPPHTTGECHLLKVTCTLNGNRTETMCQMPMVIHQRYMHATFYLAFAFEDTGVILPGRSHHGKQTSLLLSE